MKYLAGVVGAILSLCLAGVLVVACLLYWLRQELCYITERKRDNDDGSRD